MKLGSPSWAWISSARTPARVVKVCRTQDDRPGVSTQQPWPSTGCMIMVQELPALLRLISCVATTRHQRAFHGRSRPRCALRNLGRYQSVSGVCADQQSDGLPQKAFTITWVKSVRWREWDACVLISEGQ